MKLDLGDEVADFRTGIDAGLKGRLRHRMWFRLMTVFAYDLQDNVRNSLVYTMYDSVWMPA
jgi:hypothetical protein